MLGRCLIFDKCDKTLGSLHQLFSLIVHFNVKCPAVLLCVLLFVNVWNALVLLMNFLDEVLEIVVSCECVSAAVISFFFPRVDLCVCQAFLSAAPFVEACTCVALGAGAGTGTGRFWDRFKDGSLHWFKVDCYNMLKVLQQLLIIVLEWACSCGGGVSVSSD